MPPREWRGEPRLPPEEPRPLPFMPPHEWRPEHAGRRPERGKPTQRAWRSTRPTSRGERPKRRLNGGGPKPLPEGSQVLPKPSNKAALTRRVTRRLGSARPQGGPAAHTCRGIAPARSPAGGKSIYVHEKTGRQEVQNRLPLREAQAAVDQRPTSQNGQEPEVAS